MFADISVANGDDRNVSGVTVYVISRIPSDDPSRDEESIIRTIGHHGWKNMTGRYFSPNSIYSYNFMDDPNPSSSSDPPGLFGSFRIYKNVGDMNLSYDGTWLWGKREVIGISSSYLLKQDGEDEIEGALGSVRKSVNNAYSEIKNITNKDYQRLLAVIHIRRVSPEIKLSTELKRSDFEFLLPDDFSCIAKDLWHIQKIRKSIIDLLRNNSYNFPNL